MSIRKELEKLFGLTSTKRKELDKIGRKYGLSRVKVLVKVEWERERIVER